MRATTDARDGGPLAACDDLPNARQGAQLFERDTDQRARGLVSVRKIVRRCNVRGHRDLLHGNASSMAAITLSISARRAFVSRLPSVISRIAGDFATRSRSSTS